MTALCSDVQGRQAGQAAVETVAAIPLALLAGLLCMQGLVVGACAVQADNAAHAAAVAYAESGGGAAAIAAARRALPGWSRGRVAVRLSHGRAIVTLRPRVLVPGVAPELSSRAPLPNGAGRG